ncbi:hypothetical protein A2U01_0103543, partial [Trifolium medium]|nr:hypothetical protein [Trifolium medium]
YPVSGMVAGSRWESLSEASSPGLAR